jgi:hypothetical protein
MMHVFGPYEVHSLDGARGAGRAGVSSCGMRRLYGNVVFGAGLERVGAERGSNARGRSRARGTGNQKVSTLCKGKYAVEG